MDFLVRELLLVLMLGSTHYIDVGKPHPAIIYYEDGDSAHMIFPNGKTVSGNWHLTEGGYYVDWTDGPEGEWRIARTPGRFYYVDSSGAERGDITRIVPGDSERLAE